MVLRGFFRKCSINQSIQSLSFKQEEVFKGIILANRQKDNFTKQVPLMIVAQGTFFLMIHNPLRNELLPVNATYCVSPKDFPFVYGN